MQSIGHSALVLHPWDAPVALTRLWCLHEAYSTLDAGVRLDILLSPAQEASFSALLKLPLTQKGGFRNVALAMRKADMDQAKAFKRDDELMIRRAVDDREQASARIHARLREWLVRRAAKALSEQAKAAACLASELAAGEHAAPGDLRAELPPASPAGARWKAPIEQLLAAWAGRAAATDGAPADAAALSAVDVIATRGVSLAFLKDFAECLAAQPGGAALTSEEVVQTVIKPCTHLRQCSFFCLAPHVFGSPSVFASHAWGNRFSLLVAVLCDHFRNAVLEDVYVWVDCLAVNQHNAMPDLHDGLTLTRTIELSANVLVVLDSDSVPPMPLTRLWCLFEMGFTPPTKLVFLSLGNAGRNVAALVKHVDVETAGCQDNPSEVLIRSSILKNHESEAAFSRKLRVLLLLQPTTYVADTATVQHDLTAGWRLGSLHEFLADGERLACIVAGPGEGKTALAVELCKPYHNMVHAYHFCTASDVRFQDVGQICRSLAYQLALRFPAFAARIVGLMKLELDALHAPAKAWRLLLEQPLRALKGQRIVLLFDALDEAEVPGKPVSAVLKLLLLLGRLQWSASVSIIVTTRRVPQILDALRGCWRSYREFQPTALHAAVAADASRSALLCKVTALLQAAHLAANTPGTLDEAYASWFEAGTEHGMGTLTPLLSVLLAARQPPPMALLQAMGLREHAASLPGWGVLFARRDHCLHMLHRSVLDWLESSAAVSSGFSANILAGHRAWASHLWLTWLQPWLFPQHGREVAPEPPKGSYVYAHALSHLMAAGCIDYARRLLLSLAWLQATLRERGLTALLRDVAAHTAAEDGTFRTLHGALLRARRCSAPMPWAACPSSCLAGCAVS
jgi:hypothetical protein